LLGGASAIWSPADAAIGSAAPVKQTNEHSVRIGIECAINIPWQ
jgi:hypothetical protein